MDLIGKTLGNRYEVLEKVGNGGMATVYRAKDKTLGRNVAIKVLKEEYANDQEFIKRFQIEAQSAASLSHPNIVSIYDVSNDEDIHYIVMELIEGKTLKDVIKNQGKLDWRESVEIASQIASGLSTAHKNHIIHRDIKPHNIIMTRDGLAKITDFGIAKAATSSTINANSSSMGSVHYFSPEHARGGYTDEKSDIYSLGIVLYEMVTGKLPFDGDSPVSIAMKHLKEPPVEPIELVPEIPKGLNDIILKALQKEVSSRYSNAQEMYNELQSILKDPNNKNIGISRLEDGNSTQKVPRVSSTTTRISPVRLTTTQYKSTSNVKTNDKKGVNMEKKKSQKTKANPFVVVLTRFILVLLIGSLVAGGTYLVFSKMMEPEVMVEVPNVVGSSKETAQIKLENVGFVMELDAEEMESDYPKGYIAKQSAVQGKKLAKGSKITVTVSGGPRKVTVPDVEGLSLSAATAKLRNEELEVEYVEEESEEVAANKIIRQEPRANTTAYAGDTVVVYISTGIPDDKAEVPNVLDDTEAEAVEKLRLMGFDVGLSRIKDTSKEDGQILSQMPQAGTMQLIGTTVYIVVNTLKEDVIVIEPVILPAQDNTTDPNEQPTPSTETSTTPNKPTNNDPKPVEPTKPTENVPDSILKVNLSNKGNNSGTFSVKVILNGDIKGRGGTIYEANHSRKDGTINVPYPGDATGILRVYIDGKIDSEQVIG